MFPCDGHPRQPNYTILTAGLSDEHKAMTTVEYMYNRAQNTVSNIALHGMIKAWKKLEKMSVSVASIHGCDWLVLEKCKKITRK